jgi:hypothetical protein
MRQSNSSPPILIRVFPSTIIKHSLLPDKTIFMLFYTNTTAKDFNIKLFIKKNSPGIIHENPNLVHRMEKVEFNSKIPAMIFLSAYFDPSLNLNTMTN